MGDEQKHKIGKERKVAQSVMDLLNGNVLTRQEVVTHLPFLLFLAFISLVYIANGYMAEGAVRKQNKLTNEIKELRSEQITSKSELNHKTIESELIKIIEDREMGLEESYSPPKKILIDKDQIPDSGI